MPNWNGIRLTFKNIWPKWSNGCGNLEFGSISASLNLEICPQSHQTGWFLLASFMTPPPSLHLLHRRKCLRGGRCRQVLGFAHLLYATFGRPLSIERIKLPKLPPTSFDLPVTIGRHLERRRALCRCSSRPYNHSLFKVSEMAVAVW